MANPTLLGHTFARLATLSVTSEVANNPIRNIQNDKRHEFWEATGTARQNITIDPGPFLHNFITNNGFEASVDNWILNLGGNIATWTRHTTTPTPIEGIADGKLDVTTFTSGFVTVLWDTPFDLKKDVTYAFLLDAQGESGSVSLEIFFLDSDGTTILGTFTNSVLTTVRSMIAKFTPTVDKVGVKVGFRVAATTTLHIDRVILMVQRKIDTLIIDGHNLHGATVDVKFKDKTTALYGTASGQIINGVAGNAVIQNSLLYITFDLAQAAFWRVTLDSLDRAARVSGLYLGQRFVLPERPSGQIDPFGLDVERKDQTSIGGHTSRVFLHGTNAWVIDMLGPGASRADMDQLRDDIEAGRYPFWLNFNTDAFPTQWHLYLTDTDQWRVEFESGGVAIVWRMPVKEIGPIPRAITLAS